MTYARHKYMMHLRLAPKPTEESMKILVGHVKGGVGKTTISVNLSAARASQGRKVWHIDGDRRPSSSKAITIRNDMGNGPGIALSHYPDGKTLRTQIALQGESFDDIIIDAGGQDSTSFRAALMIADVLLVPNGVKALETWAFEELNDLLEETTAVRPDLQIHCLLNNARPGVNNAQNIAAAKVLEYYPLLGPSKLTIVRRDAWPDAAGFGTSVAEMKHRDPKACIELKALLALTFGDQ